MCSQRLSRQRREPIPPAAAAPVCEFCAVTGPVQGTSLLCTDAHQAAGLQQGLDQEPGPSQYSRGQAGRQRGSYLLPAGASDHILGLGGNVRKGSYHHFTFSNRLALEWQQPAQGSTDGDPPSMTGEVLTHCLQASMIICLTWGWFPLMELPQPL